MQQIQQRFLDAHIATDVLGWGGVAWYRRQSKQNGVWEPCRPYDHTPDNPQWSAVLMYRAPDGSLHGVPQFSTNPEAALVVKDFLLDNGLTVKCVFAPSVTEIAITDMEGLPLAAGIGSRVEWPSTLCQAVLEAWAAYSQASEEGR